MNVNIILHKLLLLVKLTNVIMVIIELKEVLNQVFSDVQNVILTTIIF